MSGNGGRRVIVQEYIPIFLIVFFSLRVFLFGSTCIFLFHFPLFLFRVGGSSTIEDGDFSTIEDVGSSAIEDGDSTTFEDGGFSTIEDGDSTTLEDGGFSTMK